MRRLTVFLTVLICFALLACSGSSSNKAAPKSSIIVHDLAVYEYVCGDFDWGNVAEWPTYTVYEGKCYTLLSQVSSPSYNIYSYFAEIIDPTGSVDASETLYTGDNSCDLCIRGIYWKDPLPELYCGTHKIEFWVKDLSGLDSNSKFVSVEAGSPCTSVPTSTSSLLLDTPEFGESASAEE